MYYYVDAVESENDPPDGRGELLRWTQEPPTEPGWYWTPNGNAFLEVVEVRLALSGKGLVVWRPGNEVPLTQGYSFWLGPLPVPKMPKG